MPSRPELAPRFFPFRPPDTQIGSSQHSVVYGYHGRPLVVKVAVSESQRSFATTEEALQTAQSIKYWENHIAERITKEGVNEEVVPPSFPVVYRDPTGTIRLAKAQKRIADAKPLSKSGIQILHMSDEALRSLKGILKANLKFWRDEKKSFDLLGSSAPEVHASYPRKIINHVFPIFNSQNIVSSKDEQVHFIDAAHLVEHTPREFHRWLGQNLLVAGTAVSLGLINGVLKTRELKTRATRSKK